MSGHTIRWFNKVDGKVKDRSHSFDHLNITSIEEGNGIVGGAVIDGAGPVLKCHHLCIRVDQLYTFLKFRIQRIS